MVIKKFRLIESIFFLTIGTLFAYSLVLAILACTKIVPNSQIVFFEIFCIFVLLRLVFLNKKTVIVSIILIVLSFLILYIEIQINKNIYNMFIDFIDFFKTTMYVIFGYENYSKEYDKIIILLLCFILSFFTLVFFILKFRFLVLLFMSSSILIVCFTSGYYKNTSSFLIYTFCIISLLFLNLNKNKHSNNISNNNFYNIIFVIPLIIFSMFIGNKVPIPKNKIANETFDKFIKEPFYKVNKFVNTIFYPKYFSFYTTGYSKNNNILGGNINPNDNIIMEVNSDKSLYLAGSIKDKYTGFSWENTAPLRLPFEFENDKLPQEFIERISSFFAQTINNDHYEYILTFFDSKSNNSDIQGSSYNLYENLIFILIPYEENKPLQNKKAIINIKDYNTSTIFTSEILTNVKIENETPNLVKNSAGDLATKKLMKPNTKYTLEFFENQSLLNYIIILKNSYKGLYKDIYDKTSNLHKKYNLEKDQLRFFPYKVLGYKPFVDPFFGLYGKDDEEILENETTIYEDYLKDILIPYSESIYSRYLDLPENFPQRVIDLTNEITKNNSSDYYKALDILDYLYQYPYTLTPGVVPEDRDFVDYFLFDIQKGYCTYFATAFVTMCRSIGIPARYVEGFVTPSSKENDLFVITNKEGHAWAEAYFEGFGWYRFDPTPPSSSERIISTDPNISSIFAENSLKDEDNFYISNNKDNITENYDSDNDDPDNTSLNENSKISRTTNIFVLNFFIAILIFVFLVLLIAFLKYYFKKTNENKIYKLNSNEIGKHNFRKILKYLDFFGYKINQNETILQFSKKIESNFKINNEKFYLLESAEVFSKACYSKNILKPEELKIITEVLNSLDEYFKKTVGNYKYFYYIYLDSDF